MQIHELVGISAQKINSKLFKKLLIFQGWLRKQRIRTPRRRVWFRTGTLGYCICLSLNQDERNGLFRDWRRCDRLLVGYPEFYYAPGTAIITTLDAHRKDYVIVV